VSQRTSIQVGTLGVFLGNWLICPLIFNYSFERGFATGAIAAVLMLAVSSFFKEVTPGKSPASPGSLICRLDVFTWFFIPLGYAEKRL
jgi:hypothetical protein